MSGGQFAKAEKVAKVVVWASAALVALVLAWLFVPTYLNTDTAQYVVSARHLLRGDGFATSLIYFEQQIVGGSIPAPQTVWPPGYPALIAAAMFVGIPFGYAPFLIALISHVMTAAVLFALLRRIGCDPWLAAGGAVANVIAVLFAVMVLRGLSEPTYTLMTVVAAWLVVVAAQSQRVRLWLMVAGAATAASFLIRYAGIAFVSAFGLTMASTWLAERSKRSFWNAVLAMTIPAAVIGCLFLRNYALVGSFSGGPSIDTGSQLGDVVRATLWAFRQVFGAVDAVGDISFLFAVLAMAVATIYLGVTAWRGQRHSDWMTKASVPVLVLSVGYILATVAMYGYMAVNRTPELLSARYFLPLLPFMIIVVCMVIAVVRRSLPTGWSRKSLVTACAVAVVCFVATQAWAIPQWYEWLRNDTKFTTMVRSMDEEVDGRSLRQIVDELTGTDGALLAVDGQLLGMWLDKPVVGLSEAAWTSRTWTAEEVRKLVRQYDVRVVCEFPSTFDAAAKVNQHRVFFIDLAQGRVPSWLRLVASTDSARLYEVLDR